MVVSSIIGSQNKKELLISVKGFSRNIMKARLEELISEIESMKNELAKLKQKIWIPMQHIIQRIRGINI